MSLIDLAMVSSQDSAMVHNQAAIEITVDLAAIARPVAKTTAKKDAAINEAGSQAHLNPFLTRELSSSLNKYQLIEAANLYAHSIRGGMNRQEFVNLVVQGRLAEARKFISKKGRTFYQDFQLEPARAVYPGGLDLKIFELFPNLETAHFINNRPFQIPFKPENIVFIPDPDKPNIELVGQRALDAMLHVYLENSDSKFIDNRPQERIVYGDTYNKADKKIQIGMEPFIWADLHCRGAHRIEIKPLSSMTQGVKVYEIRFDDLLDIPRTIYYHEMDFFRPVYAKVLEDDLKKRRVGLLFFKAFPILFFEAKESPKCPDEILQGLSPKAIIITDKNHEMVPDAKTAGKRQLFDFLGARLGISFKLTKIGRLGGNQSPWGPLGYGDGDGEAMHVYRLANPTRKGWFLRLLRKSVTDQAMLVEHFSLTQYKSSFFIEDELHQDHRESFAMNSNHVPKIHSNTGGIDLTASRMDLQTINEGIKFHLDSSMIKKFQSAIGFFPVIVSIKPKVDLHEFLGIS